MSAPIVKPRASVMVGGRRATESRTSDKNTKAEKSADASPTARDAESKGDFRRFRYKSSAIAKPDEVTAYPPETSKAGKG